MKKLELKHLAPYFPYELTLTMEDIIDGYEEKSGVELIGLYPAGVKTMFDGIQGFSEFEFIKPILRPISDIKKEIDIKGRKISLYKLLYEMFGGGFKSYESFEADTYFFYDSPAKFLSYDTIQLYFENHFDVFGLIPAGLAIDINTL